MDWEIFVRERELASYKLEKEKRKNLYEKIQKIILECKEESKLSNEKFQHLIQERLFGDLNLEVFKNDYKIPPQHNIQFYLKATNPTELDVFFKNSEFYLSKLISKTNNQLEYLHTIKAKPKWAQKYENKHFLRLIGKDKIYKLRKDYEENTELEKIKNNYENDVIIKKLEIQNDINNGNILREVKILKEIDKHIRSNNYNKFNLTAEQKQELNRIRKVEYLKYDLKNQAQHYLQVSNKNDPKQIKTYYYKNNQNSKIDKFNLNYNQRMLAIFDNENISNDFTTDQLNSIAEDIKKTNNQMKIIKILNHKKEIEQSFRRKKKYHLPLPKNSKTSIDKYENEDEYYLVENFTESNFYKLNNKREINSYQDSKKL